MVWERVNPNFQLDSWQKEGTMKAGMEMEAGWGEATQCDIVPQNKNERASKSDEVPLKLRNAHSNVGSASKHAEFISNKNSALYL
jgi:hypothetical protein